jgi:uncharacterized Tic20 family protein
MASNVNALVDITTLAVWAMLMSARQIHASMDTAKMESINLYVTVHLGMVENAAKLILMSAARILASTVVTVRTQLTLTLVTVCPDMRVKIARQILTIVSVIHAKMEDRVSISSTVTRVFAEFRLRAKIVKAKWIPARPIGVKTEQSVRRAQIIKTFTAHVRLVTRDVCVMKI